MLKKVQFASFWSDLNCELTYLECLKRLTLRLSMETGKKSLLTNVDEWSNEAVLEVFFSFSMTKETTQ